MLWGLHMVQSGVLRAFGSDLRRVLSLALKTRFSAFFAGLSITALLQSSTATGLMTATFVGDGLVGLVPARVPPAAARNSPAINRRSRTSLRRRPPTSSSAPLARAPSIATNRNH